MPPQPSVLVVDDERIIADTLALILKQKGFNASAAYSGESAVADCAAIRPDLLISDVMMGALNGIEAAIEICRRCPGCRVLLISGQGATGDLLEDAKGRGHDFEILAKPVHPAELLRRVHALLDSQKCELPA